MTYNLIYYDGKSNRSYAKRFHVIGVTRDKYYDLTQGGKGSKVLYLVPILIVNPKSFAVYLYPNCRARKKPSILTWRFAD